MRHESKAEDRELLKEYLGRYKRAMDKQKELEDRKRKIKANINMGQENTTSMKIRIREIEDRIEAEKEEMARLVLETMDIMDYLPRDSVERSMLEMRHIDCLGWREICRRQHMSRTPCNNYYRAGLDAVLRNKRVLQILRKYREADAKGKGAGRRGQHGRITQR